MLTNWKSVQILNMCKNSGERKDEAYTKYAFFPDISAIILKFLGGFWGFFSLTNWFISRSLSFTVTQYAAMEFSWRNQSNVLTKEKDEIGITEKHLVQIRDEVKAQCMSLTVIEVYSLKYSW